MFSTKFSQKSPLFDPFLKNWTSPWLYLLQSYFEDNEDEVDPVDFNEFMVRPKLDAKARKQSMWMAEQIAMADSVSFWLQIWSWSKFRENCPRTYSDTSKYYPTSQITNLLEKGLISIPCCF